MTQNLEQRLARLEAESAIRRLKARYLNAADAKDAAAMRACFSPDAKIVFPPLGEFDVDGLMDVFTQMAVSSAIVDQHQGHNAEIDIIDETHAKAIWHLAYTMIDPVSGAFRLLSTFYFDEYVRTVDGWRIAYTRSAPRAIIDGKLEAGSVTAHWTPVQ